MKIHHKKRIAFTIGLSAAAFLFLPAYFARASDPGVFSLLTTPFSSILQYMAVWLFEIVGNLISIVAKALNYAVLIRAGGSIPVVAATWKILRDFSNMFFIVLLIYMAFATIFNQNNYRFQDMIGRFIFVAVLINFSLVLGNLVIDACQVLTNIFIGSIGNLGDRLGTYLNPIALLPNGVNPADLAASSLVSLVFALIMALIFLFSLLVAMAFATIRVPFIWGLLIVSPIAWMSNLLPNTKNSQYGWKGWWSQFMGWNLFLPVYLFFMYLGLMFLSKRDEVISAVLQFDKVNGTNPANTPLISTLTSGLTFNLLFFYIFAGVVMVGGTWAARQTTRLMGSGFDKGYDWARFAVGRVTGYDAARKAGQQKYNEILAGTGSKLPWVFSGTKQDATLNRLLRNEVGQKGFIKEAEKATQRIEDEYDAGRLNVDQLRNQVQSTSANTAEGFAYRKLAIKKGALDDNQFRDALLSSEKNPFVVDALVKAAKDNKFDGIKDLKGIVFDDRFKGSNFTPAKREILSYMASDPKSASKFSSLEDVEKAVSILGGPGSPESRKFLNDLAKVRPDLVFKYKAKHATPENRLFAQPSDQDIEAGGKKSTMPTLYDTIRKSLNTEAKNIASMPDDIWKSGEFKTALRDKLFNQNVSPDSRKKQIQSLEKILNEQGADDKLAILNQAIIDGRLTERPDLDKPEQATSKSEPVKTRKKEAVVQTTKPEEKIVLTDRDALSRPVGDAQKEEDAKEYLRRTREEMVRNRDKGGGGATGVSYNSGVHKENIIDLRTGEYHNEE
jgi:hypothetical protein